MHLERGGSRSGNHRNNILGLKGYYSMRNELLLSNQTHVLMVVVDFSIKFDSLFQ